MWNCLLEYPVRNPPDITTIVAAERTGPHPAPQPSGGIR
jgi:hypothetical protein